MKRNQKYFFLFIIPVLFFISGNLLKEGQGPYYLNFYDPSYVYLINSLNLAQANGYGVGHIDHPGTTVQLIGAAVVYTYHSLSNKDSDISVDVLERPEKYLYLINKILGILSTVMLLILGIFTFKFSGNLLYAMIIQLSPFTSMEIFYGYIIVTPDNFLIVPTLCLITVLIYYLYKVDDTQKTNYGLITIFAVITGLGMATKLNFLPMAFIPVLLIKGVQRKLVYFLSSIIFFHIFIFPALENYAQFTEWVTGLIIYSGHYGQGEATIVNSSELIVNLGHIFVKDPFFTFTYLTVVATLLICFKKKDKIEKGENVLLKKQLKLLFIIFLAVTFQIFLVAKQYRQHYMIPSFLMSVLSLTLCASVLSYHFKKIKIRAAYVSIIILVSLWGLIQIIINYDLAIFQRTEAYKIEEYVKDNYPGEMLIAGYTMANKETALAFGASYAGSQKDRYHSIIIDKYNVILYYNTWINSFEPITKSRDVKYLFENRERVIVQIPHYEINDFMNTLKETYGFINASYEKVYTNGNFESVFVIKLNNK